MIEKIGHFAIFVLLFPEKNSQVLKKQVIWSFSAKIVTGHFQIPQNLPARSFKSFCNVRHKPLQNLVRHFKVIWVTLVAEDAKPRL